jgi:GNAT superfamily N-acetyltransferase
VVTYYCLATGSVRRAHVPSRLGRNTPDPVPVIILGRLAVDRQFSRRGMGSAILKDAFARVLQASAVVGCRAVLVHAIDDEAAAFYAQYGFIEYPASTRTFFLPIETLAAAV